MRTATRRLWLESLALGATLATACAGETDPQAEADAQSSRDQYELAALIDEAKRQPAEASTTALEHIRRDWLGARMHWEIAYSPTLCAGAGPCVALPFDHARHRSEHPQGWLPRLELSQAQRKDLARRCAEVDGHCVFAFEGTLTHLELGRERPTSLAFTDVELGAHRGATPDESWVRRRPAPKSIALTDPHVTLSRTGSESR